MVIHNCYGPYYMYGDASSISHTGADRAVSTPTSPIRFKSAPSCPIRFKVRSAQEATVAFPAGGGHFLPVEEEDTVTVAEASAEPAICMDAVNNSDDRRVRDKRFALEH